VTQNKRALKIDFVIPASPNDAFYSQIAMFRLGLDALGGVYRTARIAAVFGDSRITGLPEKWKAHFERIDVEWADPSPVESFGYRAQSDRRFDIIRPDADVAVSCDADTLLIRPFEQATMDAVVNGALGGVIAHYHFPWAHSSEDPSVDWSNISQSILGKRIDTPYRYTLAEFAERGCCPFYVNLGLLIGSPKTFHRLNESCKQIKETVIEILNNRFYEQVTVALAVIKSDIKAIALPFRYNFPNDPVADKKYLSELRHVRLIHYLRTERFDRHKIFADQSAFDAFMKLDLSGSNFVLQSYVRDITGGVYPFSKRPQWRISVPFRILWSRTSKVL
jgi:hypothetical protein